jgi:hypothetical protein
VKLGRGRECFGDVPAVEGSTKAHGGRAVFHVTELDNGSYHVTGTLAGTFTAVADGVTYMGHFAQWFGENENARNSEGSMTFIVNGRGADGTRISFSEVFHYQITATGVETSFDKPLCH